MISRICMLAAAFALLGSAVVLGQGATTISGPVFDGPGSIGPLNGVFIVNGPINVPAGETLTLQSGCVIKFAISTPPLSLVVNGNLVADGTGGSIRPTITSIRDDSVGGVQDLSGNAPAPEDWGSIRLSAGSSLDLTSFDIRYGRTSIQVLGGGGLAPGGMQLHDVNITDGALNAIECDGAECTLQDVSILRHGGLPVETFNARFASQISNLVIADCAEGNVVDMDFSNVDTAVTIDPSNTANGLGAIVSLFGRTIEIKPTGHLTLEAGVVIKGGNNNFNIDGTLTCNGTAASPVVFTRYTDDSFGGDSNNDGAAPPPPGFSIRSLSFRAGSDASTLKHTKILNTSQGNVVRISNTSPTFEDCEIAFGAGDGIAISGTTPQPTIRRCSIHDCGGQAMTGVHVSALPNFDRNLAFNNGGGDTIFANLSNGLLGAGTVTIGPRNFLNDQIILSANPTFDVIDNGDRLRILDGSIIKFFAGGGLRVGTGGAIDVLGTAARPVLMTQSGDDSIGGDSFNDGNGPGASWRGITYLTNAAASRCEYLKMSSTRNPALTFQSPLTTARSITVNSTFPTGSTAVDLVNLAAPADNFIVQATGATRQIRLRNNVSLRHATVVNGNGVGIEALSGWTGSVTNSISFNNAGGNYGGMGAADVSHSLGDFAGMNNNIVADPMLVDPANGDFRLQAGSPAINTAELGTGAIVGADHDENPRVLGEMPGGTVLPDMGALEHITHVLTLTGTGRIGEVFNVNASGPDLNSTVYAIGFADVPFVFQPFGTLLIGPFADLIVDGPFPAGTARFLALPNNEALIGFEFALQALVNVTTSVDDQLTNMVRIRIN